MTDSTKGKLEIPLIIEEWTNSRQFVYWSQMDTIEWDIDD